MSKVTTSVMEKSKSHGKKSDKGTHTSMLKVFKDMMQLENNDPEKTNLLNEKERYRKKKQYSLSRTKTDYVSNRSCDSSSSERIGDCQPVVETRQYDIHTLKTSLAQLTRSKDSEKISKDTSSCGSCALKRLATSEYACLVCLGVVFAITIVVAFFMVFKTPPCHTGKTTTAKPCRRIFKGVNYADISLKDGLEEDRSDWDDSQLGRFNEMPGLPDLDDSSSKGLNFVGPNSQFTDLAKIIDINKLNNGKSSERLKSFYKKLLQADDQIKNLKKGFSDSLITMKNAERVKRSLKHHRLHHHDHGRRRRHHRYKRNDSLTVPTSFVIEKKKILVHYPNVQTERKKVPKCSHMPKESKSHETELKHPFYKHTQRLDELLDKFMDKNLPKIMSDPFGIDNFKDADRTSTRATTNSYGSQKNAGLLQDSYSRTPDFFKISSSEKSDSDVILGVTTIMSSPKHHQSKPLVDMVPNIRKLLQIYEQDEDSLGYEDLKEVLTDEENSEAPEVKIDRNKRSPNSEPNPVFEFNKSNPSGIPIPNWKGPLPLYPDELNTMIKQDKTSAAKNSRMADKPMFTDVEYVEDYLTNKYEELAQAYSDYGVLDEKKPLKVDKQKTEKLNVDNREFSIDPAKRGSRRVEENNKVLNIAKFFNNHIKVFNGSQQRGLLSSDNSRVDDKNNKVLNIAKFFDNHFKVFNESQQRRLFSSDNSNTQFLQYTHPNEASKEGIHFGIMNPKRVDRDNPNDTSANCVVKKRTLKSISEIPQKLKSNFVTIKVGSRDDLKNDDNLFTIGYSFGEEENEIKFGNTSPKTETTKLSTYLFGNVALKKRSLKSIGDKIDKEAVSKNITDDITPMIPKKPLTHNTFSTETSLDEDDTKTSDNPEITSELVIKFVTDYNIPSEKITVNITPEMLNKSKIDFNLNIDAKKSIIDMVNLVNSRNATNKANDGMDLSDLFRMFSSWFSRLSSVSLDNNDDHSETNASSIMVIKSSGAPDSATDSNLKNTSDIVYPNYDSDMIDNIGHRSRVLMSIVEANNVTKDDKVNSETRAKPDKQITNSTDAPNNILTTTKYERDNTLEGDKRAEENKTVVKRSLSDSGLVFWSDLYDDEYGIKVDPIDKDIYGKNSRKGREFMKRSKNWIQDKVKSIAENFKDGGVKRDIYSDGHQRVYRRHVNEKSEDPQEKVTSFAELKVKMRNVCKEAAKAVQQTRKMQVRDNQEDSAANSIMQQLVRMMAELVDYQVKQKTCIKLPTDLQNFLEWLTTPQDQADNRRNSQNDVVFDEKNVLGKVKDWDTPIGTVTDEKAEYLDTLRAVEELIQQYGQMNDEEKSKMSGVRQYLESQQDFLTKQIALLDELHFSNMYTNQQPTRIRRQTATDTPKLQRNRVKRKIGRRLAKYVRNFGKKSTVSVVFDDATENSKIEAKIAEAKHTNDDFDGDNDDFNFIVGGNNGKVKEIQDYNIADFDTGSRYLDKFNDGLKVDKREAGNGMTKRNLQDVYYRALKEAKKVTTEKNIDSSNYKLD